MFTTDDFIPFKPQHTAIRNLMLLVGYMLIFSWLIDLVLPQFSRQFLYLHSNPIDVLKTPWTIATFGLGSYTLWDAVGHILWLFFFGRIIEDLLGKRPVYILFISATVFAALVYILVVGVGYGISHAIFGAGAGVAAIVFGTAIFSPFYEVFLFGRFKVQLRWIAAFYLFINAISLFKPVFFGRTLATLPGGLIGIIYIAHHTGKINIPLIDGLSRINLKKKSKPKRSASVHIHKPSKASSKSNQAEIDAILDKINLNGYGALTEKEKQTLFNKSKDI